MCTQFEGWPLKPFTGLWLDCGGPLSLITVSAWLVDASCLKLLFIDYPFYLTCFHRHVSWSLAQQSWFDVELRLVYAIYDTTSDFRPSCPILWWWSQLPTVSSSDSGTDPSTSTEKRAVESTTLQPIHDPYQSPSTVDSSSTNSTTFHDPYATNPSHTTDTTEPTWTTYGDVTESTTYATGLQPRRDDQSDENDLQRRSGCRRGDSQWTPFPTFLPTHSTNFT